MLGILTLDTAFPRVRGDVGNPETFAFPVRHATVRGALVDDIVHRRQDALLPAFVAAANELVDGGCIGIATTCGFLVRWQRELAAELEVPVLTSSLLQVPLVQRCLPRHRRVGVVTYSAADLSPEALEAAGADPYTPVAGVDPRGYFFRTIRHGAATIDERAMTQDVVAAARRLAAEHREILLLREVEGLAYGELASVLGIAEGTVKSRLARARSALLEHFDPHTGASHE